MAEFMHDVVRELIRKKKKQIKQSVVDAIEASCSEGEFGGFLDFLVRKGIKVIKEEPRT